MSLRVLTISKPYVASAYRNKLVALSATPGLEIGLICPPAWGSQNYEAPLAPESFWTRQVPIRMNGRNHFHVYRGLEEAVRAFAPQVINVEEEHYSLVTLQAFRIALRVKAVPLFYTWQNIDKRYPPPFNWIERYVFRHAGAAIGGNAESLAILQKKGYRGPMHEIPQMGVELQRFAPSDNSVEARTHRKQALGLDAETLSIGFVGRLVEEKGVQDLLHAAALLRGEKPVQIVIIGGGPYAAELLQLARQLGLGNSVIFVPQVASHGVAAYLQGLDVVCLPSLTRANWKEQFGRVLVESMAAEAVLIGSSSGEIPRVIDDAGLVFPEGDRDALAAAIRRLRDEPQLLSHFREKGRLRVRAHFTNELIAARFASAFFDAGSRRPKARY